MIEVKQLNTLVDQCDKKSIIFTQDKDFLYKRIAPLLNMGTLERSVESIEKINRKLEERGSCIVIRKITTESEDKKRACYDYIYCGHKHQYYIDNTDPSHYLNKLKDIKRCFRKR